MQKRLSFLFFIIFFSFPLFSTLYDDPEDQTELYFSDDPFGFEKLLTWWDAKPKERQDIEKGHLADIKEFLRLKLSGNMQEAKDLLQKGAANACPNAMWWLGRLYEEEKNANQAFSWHMLSLVFHMLKNESGQKGLDSAKNAISNLDNLLKSKSISDVKARFYTQVKAQFMRIPSHVNAKHNMYLPAIFVPLIWSQQHFFPKDYKITSLSIKMIKWFTDKKKFPNIQDKIGSAAGTLAKTLFDLNADSQGNYCLAISKSQDNLASLGCHILEKKCDFDQSIQMFDEKDRNKIGSMLLWKAKHESLITKLICFLIHDEVHFDADGKLIKPHQKDQMIAHLIWKLEEASPQLLDYLGCRILSVPDLRDKSNKVIPKHLKAHVAADCFRKANSPTSQENVMILIAQGMISSDFAGKAFSHEQRYEVAAKIARKVRTPAAFDLVGDLITRFCIHEDMEGKPIPNGDRYKIAAELYLQSQSPLAYFLLGNLVNLNLVSLSDSDKKNHKEYAAELYKKSGLPEAITNFALLVEEGHIKVDLEGNPISWEDSYNVASCLYRKSQTERSKFFIARLINRGLIFHDYDGNPFKTYEEGDQIAMDLYAQIKTPEAKIGLAVILLGSDQGNTLPVMQRALDLFDDARRQGDEQAGVFFMELKQKIEKIQNLLKGEISKQSEEEEAEKELELEMDESNSDDSSSDDSREELSLEDRKQLKSLKKKNRPKSNASLQFKKLLRGQLDRKERGFLIPDEAPKEDKNIEIQWDKKAIVQWKGLNDQEQELVRHQIDLLRQNDQRSGKPEKLKNCELFSRRVTKEHRLVYKLLDNNVIQIMQCWGHYNDS